MTAAVWRVSPPVPFLVRPGAPGRMSTDAPELSRLREALAAIPNDAGNSLDYDLWRNVVFSIHYATEGSDEGYALAIEFSARSPKFDESFFSERVWPYVTSERGGSVITERTLLSLAESYGWQDPDVINDFEIVAEIQQPTTNKSRFTPIPAAQFAQGQAPSWIVKDVLPKAELVVVFGASGSGKSFFVLDLVSAIAQGVPWRGKKTTKGKVIYIAAEGASGFKKRLKAYGMHHNVALEALDVAVIPDGPNFLEKADIIDLGNALLAFGRTDIVVVDTLAQVMPGDENSGADMGRVVAHCRTIHKVTGALVILIHHSGKTEGKGARGWSGLRAAADAEIEIVRSENDRAAIITKLKDGEDGAELGFTLVTIPVDMDEDGEVISSCVVEHTAAGAKGRRQLAPKGAHEKDVLGIARDLVGLDGSAPDVSVVIDAYLERNPRDPQATGRDTRRQHCLRAIKTLMDRGALVADGAALRLPGDE